jgi:uncharacterized protein
MNQIRYTKRVCTDQKRIDEFLFKTRTGVLGMSESGVPYAVPVNYIWFNGSIYFHGMGSGRKNDILFKNPFVCFTVYEEQGTVTDPVPCHADTAYMSVMLFGPAEKLTDSGEAAAVLQKMVEKYMPGFYNYALSGTMVQKYRSSLDGNAVSVYRVIPQKITAKENSAETDQLFSPEAK